MEDGLKFDYLDIINFKNIERKVVDIGGKSFLIVAKNGSGKSSLIQALMTPLDTKWEPEVAVKNGEEKGKLEVVMAGSLNGIAKKYTMEVYFSNKERKGKLTLINESGEKISAPKTFLKDLIGGISFDVMKFINATKAEKIKTLKELSGSSAEIYAAEREVSKARETKAFHERRQKDLEAFISEHNLSQEHIKKYEKEIDITELTKEYAEATKKNENWNKVESGIRERQNMIEIRVKSILANEEKMRRLEEEIAKLRDENIDMNEKNKTILQSIEQGTAWMQDPGNAPVDLSSINSRMQEALTHNNEVKKLGEVASKHAEMQELSSSIATAEANIKKAIANRDKIIAESKLPVKGLSWDESDVFYNGLPFEETQINKSQILDVGIEIAMAMSPKLKTVFLHDASLFDKDHLQAVINKVESKGYQLIAEMVGENSDLDIQFVEKDV